jgi:hypothetical protein
MTQRLGRRRVLAVALGGLFPAGRAEARLQGTKSGAADAKRDPRLSDEERKTLLLEVHKLIEIAADQAMRRISGREPVGLLSYPLGGRLTAAEAEALGRSVATPEALSAVRRVVADAVAGPVYDLLAMIDGAREPEGWEIPWQPFEVRAAEAGSAPGILHTAFQETYQEWQRLRPDPGWSLEGDKARR